ncbi:hypothetical protein H311_03392, partial [Anncaliia algerae PRA109]
MRKEIARYFLPKQMIKLMVKPDLESLRNIPESISTLLKTYSYEDIIVLFNNNTILCTHQKKENTLSYRTRIENELSIPNLFDNNLYCKNSGLCWFDHKCLKSNFCFKQGSNIIKKKTPLNMDKLMHQIPLKIVNNRPIKIKKAKFTEKKQINALLIGKLFKVVGENTKFSKKSKTIDRKEDIPVYFNKAKMTWLEARELILYFAKNVLTHFINKKRLPLFLDMNFNLFSKRPLKTKEKKRSRLGINFNLLRESFRLLQLIDSTFDYEKDLGLYRYKYSTMRQLKIIKEINFMYKILKNEDTPFILQRKIWQDFFNGVKEYLKNNLNNLILRLSNKRDKKIKPLTKQRKESVYDLTFTKNFLTNFTEDDKNRAKMHLSEAIKHYKASLAYLTNDELLNNAIKQALVSFESD